MRVDAVSLNNEGQLIADYRKNKNEIMKFFDYQPFQSLENRLEDIKGRDYKRLELASILKESNQAWGAAKPSLDAIERLKDDQSVVVVGGQQAGLLTGPLYTINKVMSILQFAKLQEKKLGVPVLPVFWIAGEDHDYEEVNHVYVQEQTKLKKYKFNQSHYKKLPISQVSLDQDLLEKWIDQLFSMLPETVNTKEIYSLVKKAQTESKSFTDFFARMIHQIFKNEGLILLDAADERIRRIESDYFVRLIENQPKISQGVSEALDALIAGGYQTTLEVDPFDAHLFYHLDGERILLKRTDTGIWQGKQGEIELETDELLFTAINHPEQLSNNVVTRPIMQELLLPTLAFIGGPGEIGYWSILQRGFHALDIMMPPVIPRLSFTYVSPKVEKALIKTGITLEEALHGGSEKQRKIWLLSKQEPPIEDLIKELKETIERVHQPLGQLAYTIRDDIGALAEKNLSCLHREIDYLQNRMKQSLEEKYEQELIQFDVIEMYLYPEGGLQERTWNPLPLFNDFGTEFISKIIQTPCSFQENHFVVYL